MIFEATTTDEVCYDNEGTVIKCNLYSIAIWFEITQYPLDLIPIGAILLFHHHNYRDKHNSSTRSSTFNNETSNQKPNIKHVEPEKHVLDLDVAQFLEASDTR